MGSLPSEHLMELNYVLLNIDDLPEPPPPVVKGHLFIEPFCNYQFQEKSFCVELNLYISCGCCEFLLCLFL